MYHCQKVAALVHASFQDGLLVEEATWKSVVLIFKRVGYYRDICLVEVVWKLVVVIINRCFTASIAFHDVLRGLRSVRGTGTTSLEAKLLQQLTSMREDALYSIFLDLHKVFDALDRYRVL